MSNHVSAAVIVGQAKARMDSITTTAAGYRDAAVRDAAQPRRPWAGMIDVLQREALGVLELGMLAAAVGDYGACNVIESTVSHAAQQLIEFSSQARQASIPRSEPAIDPFACPAMTLHA